MLGGTNVLLLMFLLNATNATLLLGDRSASGHSSFGSTIFPRIVISVGSALVGQVCKCTRPVRTSFAESDIAPLSASGGLAFGIGPCSSRMGDFSCRVHASSKDGILRGGGVGGLMGRSRCLSMSIRVNDSLHVGRRCSVRVTLRLSRNATCCCAEIISESRMRTSSCTTFMGCFCRTYLSGRSTSTLKDCLRPRAAKTTAGCSKVGVGSSLDRVD